MKCEYIAYLCLCVCMTHVLTYVFSHVLTYSHISLPIHTCPYLFTHVLTYSQMSLSIHTCSYLFPHILIYSYMSLSIHRCPYIFIHVLIYSPLTHPFAGFFGMMILGLLLIPMYFIHIGTPFSTDIEGMYTHFLYILLMCI